MAGQPNSPLTSNVGAIAPDAQITPIPNVALVVDQASGTLVDLSYNSLHQTLGTQRSVYVDNSLSGASIIVECQATGQSIICPPYATGWFPILVPSPVRLIVYAVAAPISVTDVEVNLALCNAILIQGPTQILNAATRITHLEFITLATSVLVAPVTGENIRVHEVFLSASANTTFSFNGGVSGALTGTMSILAGIPFVVPFNVIPRFVSELSESLNIVHGPPATIAGNISYVQS